MKLKIITFCHFIVPYFKILVRQINAWNHTIWIWMRPKVPYDATTLHYRQEEIKTQVVNYWLKFHLEISTTRDLKRSYNIGGPGEMLEITESNCLIFQMRKLRPIKMKCFVQSTGQYSRLDLNPQLPDSKSKILSITFC